MSYNYEEIQQKLDRILALLGEKNVSQQGHVIWKTVTIGKTKEELLEALKEVNISDNAKQMLEKMTQEEPQEVHLVRKTVRELGFQDYASTEQIHAKAKELGLELCPAEVGPALRIAHTDQSMNEWLFVAMEPIADQDGDPCVFAVGRNEGGSWLYDYWAEPGSKWLADDGFLFRLRK